MHPAASPSRRTRPPADLRPTVDLPRLLPSTAHTRLVGQWRRAPALALLALAAAGCGTRVRIPPPDVDSPAVELPEAEASVVHLPVTLSLAGIADKVEDAVPRRGGDENEWHVAGDAPVIGTVYVTEAWERDPLRISVTGGHVDVSAHVRYRARIAKKVCAPLVGCRWVPLSQCGHDGPMPTLDIGLRTTLGWSPDWRVAPRTAARPVRSGLHCRVAGARVDVTERVQAKVLAELQRAAPRVDERIREAAALHDRVEGVWRALQKPIQVADGVWLTLRPQAASADVPSGRGTTLSTDVALILRPRVVVGDKPAPDTTPLPRRVPMPPGRGFRLQLVADVPYAAGDSILAAELVGKRLSSHGQSVKVKAAHLSGHGSRLVLAVDVVGDARGTLYFVGTPVFDPATQVLTVPDLDFSLETKNVLTTAAGWLLYPSLREQMAAAARFPLAARMAQLREHVAGALNRDLGTSVRMTGTVDQLRPVGVAVRAGSVAAVFVAEGHAGITVTVH
ncbi:MAG: hypothetical protein JWM27_118 [Gemmatimonadetes bacterium]|nr:hypothetical protein [Gemmatimonadota bacterium]